MKKVFLRWRFIPALVLCLPALLFSSCSDFLTGSDSGSVSVGLNDEVLQKVALSRAVSSDVQSYSVEVNLSGSYKAGKTEDITEAMKTVLAGEKTPFTACTFTKVPVGSVITAALSIKADGVVIAQGSSEELTVSAGANSTTITVKLMDGVTAAATTQKAKIAMDSAAGTDLYLNYGTVKFNLLDSASGESLEIYDADCRLYYGNNEVDASSYTISYDGTFSISSETPLLTTGTYQLFVRLRDEGSEWATGWFDLTVGGGGYSMCYTFDVSGYNFSYTGADTAFPDDFGSVINQITEDSVLKITGEANGSYNTVLSDIKSSLPTSDWYYICLDLSELTSNGTSTTIESSCFSSTDFLKDLILPEEVTSIGYTAFQTCSDLESVTFGSKTTEIGYGAFNSCSKLKTVIIPENAPLTTIGHQAFMGCTSLESFAIPSTLIGISDSAFYECDSLTSLDFPTSGIWYYTNGQNSWGDWVYGTTTFPTENSNDGTPTIEAVSELTASGLGIDDSIYPFTTISEKVLTLAKCSGNSASAGNTGPVQLTAYLFRKTE